MRLVKPIILGFAFILTLGLIIPCARGDIPITTFFSFNGTNGYAPYAKIIQGADGNFYGTTSYGGTGYNGTPYSGTGTIFEITPSNTLTTLVSFSGGSSGSWPNALMQATNDVFYGTTEYGGFYPYAGGINFSISNGVFTTLSFAKGGQPQAEWILATDGNLYGTQWAGGNFGYGAVVKMNIAGQYSSPFGNGTAYSVPAIVAFAGVNGSSPASALVQGIDGNLYGTTYTGGASNLGTIFQTTTNGGLTTLVTFTGTNGSNPYFGALIQATDGNFYGTTYAGGTSGLGTIFKMTPSGTLTTLLSFNGTNGANPAGSLIQGKDGNFYGTTTYGGANSYGTIFTMTSAGTLHTLANFNINNGAWPFASLMQGSDGNFYGTTIQGGNGCGTIFRFSVPPGSITNPPTLVQQPINQFVQVGSSATFNVVADGSPTLNYQWQFNGKNITNATNATLTLNSVTAANDGGYSVVVSNPYGSVTSVTASLAVLTDGANGNKPVQITASPLPSKPSNATNLVFITHGWEPGLTEPPTPQWIYDASNAIQSKVSSGWQVVAYSWIDQAWTPLPETALNNADNLGAQIGKQLATQGWQNVHLIAHSAGAGLIQAIADQLEASPNPPKKIQMTFLDPFVGLFHEWQNAYGDDVNWADCYFVEDGSGGFTSGNLSHAFNVDVSWVDPSNTVASYFGPGGGEVALSSHGYPTDFYVQSITNTDPNWGGVHYGYALSLEKEGNNWGNNLVNDPVGYAALLPNSAPNAVQNPNPGIAGTEAGLEGTAVVIGEAANALSNVGASLVGDAGFLLNSIFLVQQAQVKSNGVHPLGQTDSTDTPAWLAVGVSVTNAVNFVQFDAAFTDTNSAQGLLTVYWNTNQVGVVDEGAASTNLQTYHFELPGTVTSGLYTLSFRLDSFNNSSTIAVTNVATDFVGVTQPSMLGISITNGAPMLQLTGATNYFYLIQSSTDLVNWTPTVLLLNTNGICNFKDSPVTNANARFYRAVPWSPNTNSTASSITNAVFSENFQNPPNYSNNWYVSANSGSNVVTYTSGNLRVQSSQAGSGSSITFLSNESFAGDIDFSVQLDHQGYGRTTIGLWSASAANWIASTVLDTDDTAYLAFGSGSFSTGYEYSSVPYMDQWITLRIVTSGNVIQFYANGVLLETTSFTPSGTIQLGLSVGSVPWKSGDNDTSFRQVSATGTTP